MIFFHTPFRLWIAFLFVRRRQHVRVYRKPVSFFWGSVSYYENDDTEMLLFKEIIIFAHCSNWCAQNVNIEQRTSRTTHRQKSPLPFLFAKDFFLFKFQKIRRNYCVRNHRSTYLFRHNRSWFQAICTTCPVCDILFSKVYRNESHRRRPHKKLISNFVQCFEFPSKVCWSEHPLEKTLKKKW